MSYGDVIGIVVGFFVSYKIIQYVIRELFINNELNIKYVATNPLYNRNLNDHFKYDYSACFDIQSAENGTIPAKSFKTFDTGIIMCLPYGYELQIRPRSGLCSKGVQAQFGTVDTDYRGHHMITIYNFSDEIFEVKAGDRIAQGKISKLDFDPSKCDRFTRVETEDDFDVKLKRTSRGTNGLGSTGV